MRLLLLFGLGLAGLVYSRQASGKAAEPGGIIPGFDLSGLKIDIPFMNGGSMGASQYTDMSLPRGIRNNNPGNIRKSGDAWQGLADVQPDSAFFTFKDPVFGIRALAKILRNYRDLYGLTTVTGIISRWAPPNENNTQAYAQAVASAMGVAPSEPLAFDAGQLRALVAAIIHHENGQQPYDMALISDGISRAGWA